MASSQHTEVSSFNLLYIFGIIRKHLLYIAAVVGACLVLAFIFTLPQIYKPEFMSSTIVYPTSAERYDVINLFHDEPILYLYGESKDVEKIEQLATHEEVKMMVMDSLDLWEAYGVDKENDDSPKYYGFRTYDAMVQMSRVAGNGLEIQAYDVDRDRAAEIVNLLVTLTNVRYKEMLNRNKEPMLNMYREGYQKLVDQLTMYNDSIRNVRRRLNVLNPETQTEKLVEKILELEIEMATVSYGGSSERKRLAQARLDRLIESDGGGSINLENFRDGLDQILALEEVIEYLSRDVKDAREKVEVLEAMFNTDYNTLLSSGPALPSDKKARPIRWVILLATLLLSALVAIFGAVLIDRITGAVGEEEKGEERNKEKEGNKGEEGKQ